jgi:hypothetical protein
MAQRGARYRKRIAAAGAVAGLVPTVFLLSLGPEGAEVATILAAYVAWLGVLATWLGLPSQPPAETSPPDGTAPLPGSTPVAASPRAPLSPAVKRRVIVIATALVIILAGLVSGISASPSGSTSLLVTGDVTLLQQDRWLGNQRALVIQLPDGQYGYLARPDANWWLPWSSLRLAPRWPGFTKATVFASSYSGLEFLGIQGAGMMTAYRDNYLRWHDPVPMQVNGLPLSGVSARPGFMQYTSPADGQFQFLALIPQPAEGLELYERIEHPPWNWEGPVGVMGASIRGISAVTSAELGDGSLCVIVRAGDHLFEMTHSSRGLPGGAGSGWSAPAEVRSAIGAITVSGNPQLVAATVSTQGSTELLLSVPVPGGAALLSTEQPDGPWQVEQLPVHHTVDAITLLPGSVNGRANIDVTFREGNRLLYLWRWDDGSWHGPSPVQWGP